MSGRLLKYHYMVTQHLLKELTIEEVSSQSLAWHKGLTQLRLRSDSWSKNSVCAGQPTRTKKPETNKKREKIPDTCHNVDEFQKYIMLNERGLIQRSTHTPRTIPLVKLQNAWSYSAEGQSRVVTVSWGMRARLTGKGLEGTVWLTAISSSPQGFGLQRRALMNTCQLTHLRSVYFVAYKELQLVIHILKQLRELSILEWKDGWRERWTYKKQAE